MQAVTWPNVIIMMLLPESLSETLSGHEDAEER